MKIFLVAVVLLSACNKPLEPQPAPVPTPTATPPAAASGSSPSHPASENPLPAVAPPAPAESFAAPSLVPEVPPELRAPKPGESPAPQAEEPYVPGKPQIAVLWGGYIEIVNDSKSIVTLTLNGRDLGGSRGANRHDLTSSPGKNTLKVNVAPPANGTVKVLVHLTGSEVGRPSSTKTVVSLDLSGKPGTHVATFMGD